MAKVLASCGYTLHRRRLDHVFDEDGLRTIHNHDFVKDPSFRAAYERGVRACDRDCHWRWRVHIGLWAAASASKLDGDFVECGVNHGFLSSAIMHDLQWDSLGKRFHLIDTFAGIETGLLSDEEAGKGRIEENRKALETGFYVSSVAEVRKNFEEWKNVQIVQGCIPEVLPEVDADRVAFLHIDLNNATPEVAAAEYFWDRLTPGAFVLLDDYAYVEYDSQKHAMDRFAEAKQVRVASLPTGQGLMIKPA